MTAMLPYACDAMITGVLLIFSGVLALLRQYLLDPVAAHYPKAPGWLRNCMFGFAAVLFFIGLQLVWSCLADPTHSGSHGGEGSMQLLALALAGYNAAMLGNVIRQRYPQEVWARLNRINEMLHCNQNTLVRWLSR